MDSELIRVRNAINQQLADGKTEDEIKRAMRSAGYSGDLIYLAFSAGVGDDFVFKTKYHISKRKFIILTVVLVIAVILFSIWFVNYLAYTHKIDQWKKAFLAGELAAEPIQAPYIDNNPIHTTAKGTPFTITRLAKYSITAVVLLKQQQYSIPDLSPYDFGLSWGVLADPECQEHFKFRNQGTRVLYSEIHGDLPSRCYNFSQISNNHLIPANDNVQNGLDAVTEHDIVRLDGYLVSVTSSRFSEAWSSSLSRTDTTSLFLGVQLSEGSCEIMYVEEIEVNGRVYA